MNSLSPSLTPSSVSKKEKRPKAPLAEYWPLIKKEKKKKGAHIYQTPKRKKSPILGRNSQCDRSLVVSFLNL